jgi:hypothetical protein
MLNVSGPGATLTDAASDNFKYMYVLPADHPTIAGASSPAVGTFYANCPAPYATNTGYVVPASGSAAQALTILPVFPLQSNKISQMRWDDLSDPTTMRNTRVITQSFFPWINYPYWSGRAFPDGSGIFTYTPCLMNSASPCTSAVFFAQLPPTPAWDGIDRTTWVPVSLGTAAYAKFGYAENGAPNSFFCTSRQEACIANTTTGNAAAPYVTSDTWSPCAGGSCALKAPGISGRVLYYQLYNASNAPIAGLQAVAVP